MFFFYQEILYLSPNSQNFISEKQMVKPSFARSGPWSNEDASQKLASSSKHGPINSDATPKKAGLRRCGKSCKLRWTDYSGSTAMKHESFTPEEEDLIIKMHATLGSRWPIIAQHLPGKTENDVKIFWNSKLKKKLSEMGIDPVTHRPFSHILADYGNLNGGTLIPNPSIRTGSLDRNLKYPFSLAKPPKDIDLHQVGESGDLLSHLQAIRFITDQAASTGVKPKAFLPDVSNGLPLLAPTLMSSVSSTSSSSSSSTCSTTPQENVELNFSWSDFLLDQEIFQENRPNSEELENSFGYFSEAVTITTTETVSPSENNGITWKNDENPSNGFVDTIIAKEKEMYLGFPSYFEQPFYE